MFVISNSVLIESRGAASDGKKACKTAAVPCRYLPFGLNRDEMNTEYEGEDLARTLRFLVSK
jgi:hypothetical protein